MDTEMPAEAALWRSSKISGASVPRIGTGMESRIPEGHLCPDHVHMLAGIPPKYSAVQVIGCIKGKSAAAIARRFAGKEKNFTGQNFRARGCYVSAAGRDEAVIRKYIQDQEAENKRLDQLNLFKDK
jgi:putative transposase